LCSIESGYWTYFYQISQYAVFVLLSIYVLHLLGEAYFAGAMANLYIQIWNQKIYIF